MYTNDVQMYNIAKYWFIITVKIYTINFQMNTITVKMYTVHVKIYIIAVQMYISGAQIYISLYRCTLLILQQLHSSMFLHIVQQNTMVVQFSAYLRFRHQSSVLSVVVQLLPRLDIILQQFYKVDNEILSLNKDQYQKMKAFQHIDSISGLKHSDFGAGYLSPFYEGYTLFSTISY